MISELDWVVERSEKWCLHFPNWIKRRCCPSRRNLRWQVTSEDSLSFYTPIIYTPPPPQINPKLIFLQKVSFKVIYTHCNIEILQYCNIELQYALFWDERETNWLLLTAMTSERCMVDAVMVLLGGRCGGAAIWHSIALGLCCIALNFSVAVNICIEVVHKPGQRMHSSPADRFALHW